MTLVSTNPFANAQPISLDFDVSFADGATQSPKPDLDLGDLDSSTDDPTPASTSTSTSTSISEKTRGRRPSVKAPNTEAKESQNTEPSGSSGSSGTQETPSKDPEGPLNFTLEDLEFDTPSDTANSQNEPNGPNETNEGGQTENPQVEFYINTVNKLADEVFGGELIPFEGFNEEEEPNEETILELLKHNINVQKDVAVQQFYDELPETVQRLISFSLNSNSDEEDIVSYAKVLIEKSNISSLNVSDEYDQEQIVRAWYNNEDWKSEEIEEKITDLKDAGLLEKEAKRIKPKLDQIAEQIAQRKEDEAAQIREMEIKYKKDYINRLQDLFSKDKIADVSFTNAEKQALLRNLISDDIEVPMPNNKKVKMPYLEALITYHRYSPKADLENLALATLILTDRTAFDNKYKKMIESRATSEFVKDHKYDSAKKAGALKVKDNGQKQIPQNSSKGWGNVFKK